MLVILLVMIFARGIVGNVYECRNQQITLSDDIGFDLLDKQMAPDQNCTLTFTWPDDYVAAVHVKATLDSSENIFITSNWGQTIQKNQENFMISTSAWPPNSVTVMIETAKDSQMVLTLLVERQKFSVPNSISRHLETAPNQQPFYIDIEQWKPFSAIVIESETEVALSRAQPDNTDVRDWANIFVYEGIGSDLVFRGTPYSLSAMYSNLMSTRNGFTLYYAYPSFNLKGTIVANDGENVNSIGISLIRWTPSDDFDAVYLLNASHGKSALIILSAPDGTVPIYTTKVDYLTEDASKVDLLAGGCIKDPISANTKLAEYSESAENLPQFVPGRSRTFIANSGMVRVSFTTQSDHANNEDAIDGRTGFMMSNNYPFLSKDQDSTEFILKSVNGDPFILTLDFPNKNSNTDSYLNISLKGVPGDQGGEQHSAIFSLYDLPDSTNVTYTATEISMRIYGGQGESNGTFFTYDVSYSPVSTTIDATSSSVVTTQSFETTTSVASTTEFPVVTSPTTQFPEITYSTTQLQESTVAPSCHHNFTATANLNTFSHIYTNQLCILRIDTTKGFVFVNFTGTSKNAKLTIVDLNTAGILMRPANDILETTTTSLKIEVEAENDAVVYNMAYKYMDPCTDYCGADTFCNVNAAGQPYCVCSNICDQPNSDGLSCSPVQCSKVFKSKNCDSVQNGCTVVEIFGVCTPVCEQQKPPTLFSR